MHLVLLPGDFPKIANLEIVPVVELAADQSELVTMVSPRKCFLKSPSNAKCPDTSFYQRLFKFVNFSPEVNDFLRACGVKERPECIDILTLLLDDPEVFYKTVGQEKCITSFGRLISVLIYLQIHRGTTYCCSWLQVSSQVSLRENSKCQNLLGISTAPGSQRTRSAR